MAEQTLTVEGRQFGRGNRALFPPYTLPAPPQAASPEGIAVRDLIEHVVRCEVAAFQERREHLRLIHTLTRRQITDAAEAGKVSMGGRDEEEAAVDPDAAVQVALLGFEDGLYFAFIDDVQYEALDQAVPLRRNSTLMFLRLVALAGG